jgi:hypothetical protein
MWKLLVVLFGIRGGYVRESLMEDRMGDQATAELHGGAGLFAALAFPSHHKTQHQRSWPGSTFVHSRMQQAEHPITIALHCSQHVKIPSEG